MVFDRTDGILKQVQPVWLDQNTIFLTKHGSHAYGTSTPTSDLDLRGVCVQPESYYLGFLNQFDQSVNNKPQDITVFGLRKFFELATKGNPNALEILFTDPSDHLKMTEEGEMLLSCREAFLSKKLKHTLSGYAHAQIKRIKTHRRWILHPPSHKPTRAEYGLPERTAVPADQLMAAASLIKKQIESWDLDLEPLDEASRIEFQGRLSEVLAEMHLTSDEQFRAAGRVIGLSENFLAILDKERAYNAAKAEYDQYEHWKKTRNAARYEIEEKYGYDCFTDDTEFLTDAGWKTFDEVSADTKLATVFVHQDMTESMAHRRHLGIEYQSYTEKFDGTFNGNLYELYGYHYDVAVTPNHRMLITKKERKSGKRGDWEFRTAAQLPDTFDVIHTVEPRTKTHGTFHVFDGLPYSPEDYLQLMGWYLSDGCLLFDGEIPEAVRVSQKVGGRLYIKMQSFAQKYGAGFYEYDRAATDLRPYEIREAILHVGSRNLARRLFDDCGALKQKRIPRWVFSLSKRMMEILFDAMMLGDGTTRKTSKASAIYYSSLKGIADDVCELAVHCGWETSVYGPYASTNAAYPDTAMYHVHVDKNASRVRTLMRNQNVRTRHVENQRIVCFSVPNSTLVVRRNGHVAIHGNCKHGMHVVRLIRVCLDVFRTGKYIVKRPDAEELLSIRNGAWSYDQLLAYAEGAEEELNHLYETSTFLPKEPNRRYLDQMCQSITEAHLRQQRGFSRSA